MKSRHSNQNEEQKIFPFRTVVDDLLDGGLEEDEIVDEMSSILFAVRIKV